MSFLLEITRNGAQPRGVGRATSRGSNALVSWELLATPPDPAGFVKHLTTDRSVAVLCSEGGVEATLWEAIRRAVAATPSAAECHAAIAAAAARSHGVFALIVIARRTAETFVVTDSRGIHPVYWHTNPARVVIGTSRYAVAQACDAAVDPIGIIERNAFGAPLGSRSLYRHVARSAAGQTLAVAADGTLSGSCFREGDPPRETPANIEAAAEELGSRFREAVRRRIPAGDGAQFAGLSGGLDSRVLAASAMRMQVPLNLLSFGRADTLDVHLATGFATAADLPIRHFDFPGCRRISWGMRTRLALTELGQDANPIGYWSGDGGSVCVGGVYLDDAMRDAFRAEGEAAIAEYLYGRHLVGIPRVLFSATERRAIRDTILEDLRTSIRDADTTRPGAAFRWLVGEDQRRHLDEHFAFLDVHRVHYWLPFLDRDVIEWVSSLPEQWISGHRLYMTWVRHHLPDCVAHAWQAYPGHEPCPLPMPAGVYQWDSASGERARREAVEFARQQLGREPQFPLAERNFRRRAATAIASLSARIGLARGETLREVAGDLNAPESVGGFTPPLSR